MNCSMGAFIVRAQESLKYSELIERADALVCLVKHQGKNGTRVGFAGERPTVVRPAPQFVDPRVGPGPPDRAGILRAASLESSRRARARRVHGHVSISL